MKRISNKTLQANRPSNRNVVPLLYIQLLHRTGLIKSTVNLIILEDRELVLQVQKHRTPFLCRSILLIERRAVRLHIRAVPQNWPTINRKRSLSMWFEILNRSKIIRKSPNVDRKKQQTSIMFIVRRHNCSIHQRWKLFLGLFKISRKILKLLLNVWSLSIVRKSENRTSIRPMKSVVDR